MKNIELHIHLDNNSDGVYYTGDTITGKILIDVNSERFKLNGIKLIFSGSAKVSWSEKDNGKANSSKHSYTSYEEYTRCKLYILENISNKDMCLDVGHFEYDFEIPLLPNLPTSFEHTYGFVRYKLDAILDVPWAFDVHCIKLISVINNVDLNVKPALKESISASETKTFGFCWCRSKPIIASVTLDKSGYCAGESIVFNASIQNNSSKEIKHASASLIQKVRFYARGKNKILNREVCSVSYNKRIPSSTIEEWKNVKLKISSVAPTSNNQSQIIDISYFFVLSLVISGKSSDLDIIIPIEIGTEPIKTISDTNSDLSLNNHKKCVFGLPGRNEILIDNDGVQGSDAEFVPLYPYFKKTQS